MEENLIQYRFVKKSKVRYRVFVFDTIVLHFSNS